MYRVAAWIWMRGQGKIEGEGRQGGMNEGGGRFHVCIFIYSFTSHVCRCLSIINHLSELNIIVQPNTVCISLTSYFNLLWWSNPGLCWNAEQNIFCLLLGLGDGCNYPHCNSEIDSLGHNGIFTTCRGVNHTPPRHHLAWCSHAYSSLPGSHV